MLILTGCLNYERFMIGALQLNNFTKTCEREPSFELNTSDQRAQQSSH